MGHFMGSGRRSTQRILEERYNNLDRKQFIPQVEKDFPPQWSWLFLSFSSLNNLLNLYHQIVKIIELRILAIYYLPDTTLSTFTYKLNSFLKHVNVKFLLFSHQVISDSFATRWTIARRAPLSMGFPRQEYWSGLSFLSPGDLSDPGIELVSSTLAGRFFTTDPAGKSANIKREVQLKSEFCRWWHRDRGT